MIERHPASTATPHPNHLVIFDRLLGLPPALDLPVALPRAAATRQGHDEMQTAVTIPYARRRRPIVAARTTPLALVELAVAVGLFGAVELVLLAHEPATPWPAFLFPVVGWIYAAAGLFAWWRRPANRMGALFMAGGVVWLLAVLTSTEVPALVAVGLIIATVPIAVVVHVLHAFPSGRLRGPGSRIIVLAGYFVCLVLQAPVYLWGQGASGPATALAVDDRPDLAGIGHWVQTGVGVVVMIATVIVLALRLRALSPRRRRIAAPLLAYGIFVALFVPLTGSIRQFVPLAAEPLDALQVSLLATIPVAFAVAVISGGFARTRELEQLAAWLGTDDGGRPGLASALAHVLGDPSVLLLFWVPDAGGYVDAEGRAVSLPRTSSDRAAVEVQMAGQRIGAIVYDSRLIDDPASVRDAGRVIALALERERLTAQLQAGREALRRSRARIVEAGDGERRRLARDLHDGLQTRLVLLAIAAQDVAGETAPAVRSGIQSAIQELRAIVENVIPAALSQGGLYAAAEDLADRAPIPTELRLDPPPAPLSAAVETTGWFVLSECLANVVKHAQAGALRISLGSAGPNLRIEIADDGVGGAQAGPGNGLRSMADRVEAHDGRLQIDSPPGGGTRIVMEVPCGS
jgi:signal transduction histidine kinase